MFVLFNAFRMATRKKKQFLFHAEITVWMHSKHFYNNRHVGKEINIVLISHVHLVLHVQWFDDLSIIVKLMLTQVLFNMIYFKAIMLLNVLMLKFIKSGFLELKYDLIGNKNLNWKRILQLLKTRCDHQKYGFCFYLPFL